MSTEPLTTRGTSVCRGCGSRDLVSVLDLGAQPIANELLRDAGSVAPAFPLHLRICRDCALGQVGEYVLPERIFGSDYPYLSSTSSSWVRHARAYADLVVAELGLEPGDLALEVASNDGYLLGGLQELGLRVLGVEPAANVAAIALERGVPTVTEFFTDSLAPSLVAEHGHPRLVTANNVMAHVPDLDGFVAGLAALCDDRTVITVENPSLAALLTQRQFDTIYHEHFSYLSAHSVRSAVAAHGLELFRVEQLPTHGGSNRYWLARRGTRDVEESVAAVLGSERSAGLLESWLWVAFEDASRAAVDGLRRWLDDRLANGRRVAAYGAAAKGMTLLNAAGIEGRHLEYVVDGSPEKQGCFLPGPGVPILAPAHLAEDPPDDVLLLPWNLAGEIVPLAAAAAPEAEVWVAIPEMSRLA